MLAMPGGKRRLRLVVDWTVDLLFDRDASELGQLGHPPTLETIHELEAQSAGGTGSVQDADAPADGAAPAILSSSPTPR
jgi:NADH dehydrogenase